ncbi:MAG: sulfotransferase family 2 domain-containing protein [Actinobacteria bacterium]|nr:sulfotransferase family 2 domain-containing protein [Actinomycetota bacterium]
MTSPTPEPRGLNVSISCDYNFVWFRVAKTGTRSLDRLLETEIDDYRYFERRDPIHPQLTDLLKNGCFRFSIVRNPWDRLVSAWRNKIRREFPKQAQFLKMLAGTASENEIAAAQSDFSEFVRLLPGSPLFLNEHFWPQAELLSGIELDFVGRFERYSDEITHVLNEVGLGHLASAIPHRNQSYEGLHYSEYYDHESRDLVGDIFQADIARWDYSFETVN